MRRVHSGDGKLELMVNNHVSTAAAGVFAYEVPADPRTDAFPRHTLASGFKTVSVHVTVCVPGALPCAPALAWSNAPP